MPFLGTTGGGSVKQYGGQASLVYFIKNSLRFRESASAYLNRTFGTPTNNNTWTFSTWMKRGSVTSSGTPIFVVYVDGNNYTNFTIDSNQQMNFAIVTSGSARANSITSQVFRDPSAWYHVVLVANRAEATEANRIKMYINGVQVTAWATAPTWNNSYDSAINGNGQVHRIGNRSTAYFDGYLGEINFIDGQALTPSSFGKTDAVTGQWIPKKFASTYGTNGFYLKFADASAATAAAIGKDSSPNGNNWTPNNISVTAGTTYDAMIDSPTLSAVASNYAVMNPLAVGANSSQITFSNGNLTTTWSSAGGYATAIATIGVSSGKWYWEIVNTSALNSNIGILKDGDSLASYVGQTANGYSWYTTGSKYNNASGTAYASAYAQNDVIGVALDMDGGTLTFYKNGTSQGQAFSGLSGTFFPAVSDGDATNAVVFASNFGQRPFSYTAPANHVALNTYNL